MSSKIIYVLYDGDCTFCCNIVERVSSLVQARKILFYSFRSAEGQKLIFTYSIKKLNSVIYINEGKIFFKSEAVLNICKHLEFPYKYYYAFNIMPNFLLNIGYDFIAKRRKYII